MSQYELADLVGVRQSNINFWEHSDKPPRSEVIPRLAEVLEVSVAELLDATPAETIINNRVGPVGKVRKVFEKVGKLPRNQQEKIVEVVEVFLSQYQQQNEQKTA
ncbi:MAG: helix-turn-helix transcriptional regulator [Blastocatellia bacterium]|nr:helix-turn-helix transcriptional regulator [Blastocatellia bacterium]